MKKIRKLFRNRIFVKSVSFIIALSIFGIMVCSCAFSASAAEQPYDHPYARVGNFSSFGGATVIIPTPVDFRYMAYTDNPVERSFVGMYDMYTDTVSGYQVSNQTRLYQYALEYRDDLPVAMMQIALSSNYIFVPDTTYRISFDVTPAPDHFVGFNQAWVASENSWRSLYNTGENTVLSLASCFYYQDEYGNIRALKALHPYASELDVNVADTRYRFSYTFSFTENFASNLKLYMVIRLPFSNVDNKFLTSYVYEPIIETVDVSQSDGPLIPNRPDYQGPDTKPEEDLTVEQESLQGWVDQNDLLVRDSLDRNVLSGLGSGFEYAIQGISSTLDYFYNNFFPLRYLITLSISLGVIGFLFNLAHSKLSR